jgi:hypothetical protein
LRVTQLTKTQVIQRCIVRREGWLVIALASGTTCKVHSIARRYYTDRESRHDFRFIEARSAGDVDFALELGDVDAVAFTA